MKILFVGDVFGRCGRQVLRLHLQDVKQQHQIDFTVANVENAAGGFGLTPALGKEILSYGVDVMTSGNHIFDKKEVFEYFSEEPRLLRPGNYPAGTPGNFQFVAETPSGIPVAVMNLQGRVFMPITDCPFRLAEREIPKLTRTTSVIMIDFHAEATSEKMAFAWFLDGKVTAISRYPHPCPHCGRADLACRNRLCFRCRHDGFLRFDHRGQGGDSLDPLLDGFASPFGTRHRSAPFSSVIIDVDESTGRARSLAPTRHPGVIAGPLAA